MKLRNVPDMRRDEPRRDCPTQSMTRPTKIRVTGEVIQLGVQGYHVGRTHSPIHSYKCPQGLDLIAPGLRSSEKLWIFLCGTRK